MLNKVEYQMTSDPMFAKRYYQSLVEPRLMILCLSKLGLFPLFKLPPAPWPIIFNQIYVNSSWGGVLNRHLHHYLPPPTTFSKMDPLLYKTPCYSPALLYWHSTSVVIAIFPLFLNNIFGYHQYATQGTCPFRTFLLQQLQPFRWKKKCHSDYLNLSLGSCWIQ